MAFAALFLAFLAGAPANAGPVLTQLSSTNAGIELGPRYLYLEDPSGSMNLRGARDAAAEGRFKTVGEQNPNFGYSKSAMWVWVELDNQLDQPFEWLLEIPFPTLDSIEAYLVAADGRVAARYAVGDLLPFDSRPVRHRHFVLPLSPPPGERSSLFMRFQSQGSLTVAATLWPPALFNQQSRDAYSGMSLYFGILAALFAYNFLLYLSLRDRSYLYYVLFVAGMAVGQASWNGLAYEFLWPALPAWGNLAAVAGFNATGLFGALFSRAFLNTRRAAPGLDKVLIILAAAFAAWMTLAPFIPYRVNAMLTSATGLIFSITATAGGVLCLARGFSAARFFLLAWTLLLVGTAALGARNLDLVPTNFFTLHAMQIGSALEMLLLSFALAERINLLRRGKEAAEAEAVAARREMVAALERQERDLELKVAARTGELRAVNERLVESEKTLRQLAHHDPLTGLINRALLDERLAHAIERARRHGGGLALLFIDLDGFKTVNDTHGHAAGDELLRAVGDRLLLGVRASDTVARLGGDEFVAVLEEVNRPADAAHVAEKLVASLAEPFSVGARPLTITASVGVSLYPADGPEAPTLLKWADRAMYDAKLGGKNRVRYSAGLKKALEAHNEHEARQV